MPSVLIWLEREATTSGINSLDGMRFSITVKQWITVGDNRLHMLLP